VRNLALIFYRTRFETSLYGNGATYLRSVNELWRRRWSTYAYPNLV